LRPADRRARPVRELDSGSKQADSGYGFSCRPLIVTRLFGNRGSSLARMIIKPELELQSADRGIMLNDIYDGQDTVF